MLPLVIFEGAYRLDSLLRTAPNALDLIAAGHPGSEGSDRGWGEKDVEIVGEGLVEKLLVRVWFWVLRSQ